jgi:hypothetical protein
MEPCTLATGLRATILWFFSGVGTTVAVLLLHRWRERVADREFRRFEGEYQIYWRRGEKLDSRGSSLRLAYLGGGVFTTDATKPDDPSWDWTGSIELKKVGTVISGEGRYRYTHRLNDAGLHSVQYMAGDGWFNVSVDNESTQGGVKEFKTVWKPVRNASKT